ncbi:hypothetical protein MA16_Dca026134 [Dendrobium catenatum]|uniref:Uncharacterized protein n=1 Tax=Dendrobium catenatum TaxID=906689 RepID=A0A2I0V7V1_9ASPA|nr:hypothetical protein MA16_Dca026134 [Dendrobium catenatum]
MNDDMIKSETKKSVIKQEDLECLSRSKLDSNMQKLNDDKIKSERKRTPLKSLNYSTF